MLCATSAFCASLYSVRLDVYKRQIYITATKKELDELFETGCEMIAMDATLRDRPNGEKLEDLVNYVHEHGVLAMADCSTYEECVNAERIGFDCVSTTLCGYTPYSKNVDGPNLELFKKDVYKRQVVN